MALKKLIDDIRFRLDRKQFANEQAVRSLLAEKYTLYFQELIDQTPRTA